MNRYRQIVVHAGLSKTGTTSIQEYCRKQSVFLREYGIIYPQFSFNNELFVTHSIPVTASITGSPRKYGLRLHQRFSCKMDDVIRDCRRQLEQLLDHVQGHTLLISTELIEGFEDEDMATLRAWLKPRAETLRVIAYIRSPQSALESMLQERVKAGAAVEPDNFVGRIRQKYENLQRNFPDELEVINYHDAQHHPFGLLGSFLPLVGISEQPPSGWEFDYRNLRLSMEAYALMSAINVCFPVREQDIHKITRYPNDLDVLAEIPGPPFQLINYIDSPVYRKCIEEAAWLESRLGFRFPDVHRREIQPLWQDDTLRSLGRAINKLKDDRIRLFVAEYLRDEALNYRVSRPATAEKLTEIFNELMAGSFV